MILYNMRYRGPYEYDKFALNILQIINAINLNELNELSTFNNANNSLIANKNNIDNIYKDLIGTSTSKGISEKIYEESFNINGGF